MSLAPVLESNKNTLYMYVVYVQVPIFMVIFSGVTHHHRDSRTRFNRRFLCSVKISKPFCTRSLIAANVISLYAL
jgi:hypothetical protein